MSAPDVSVVIPTRNRRDLCRLAVESCLTNQDVAVEIIVVDDGSTDDTLGYLADLPIVGLRQEWAGRSAARNRGIGAATAPLVAFLDSDDLSLPRRFDRQLNAMAPADIGCWGQVSFIDDMGAPLPDDTAVIQREIEETAARGATPEVLAVRMRIYPSTVLVSQDAIAAVGGFDEDMLVAEDIEWLLRVRRHGSLAFVPEPLSLIRHHEGNTQSAPMFTAAAAFTERLATQATAPGDRRYRARLRHYRARALWSLGDNHAAARAGWSALRDDPTVVFESGFLKRHLLAHLPAKALNARRPGLRSPE
ncbi:MAG: glycosyltransferase [Actinobacteria bacterium]|uniref:Unannotated protein n=1 Tax=freshwater metagenome TaxID=449393 RepID=A0A6J6QLR9_9ZZZZ|nr:glycosyltransferase [Actinomycetota bacterium]